MRFAILFFLLLFNLIYVHAQRKCGSVDRLKQMIEEDSRVQKQVDDIEDYVRTYIEREAASKRGLEQEYIIPIVFQVVYHPNSPAQNISDEKIIEQIEILNRDFNGLNPDIVNVPDPFKASIGHLNIRFVLANRDPDGKFTTGIVRTPTTKSSPFKLALDDVKKPGAGGVQAWDTKRYLNVWVCNLENSYLGYSSFANEAGTSRDGFVLGYKYVGYTNNKSFNLGRTSTHELGHYFNLRHIWGDDDNCTSDDGISDTPQQYTFSSGNPTFPYLDQCSPTFPGIMFMNFMDYSNDSSLLMFTKEQALKMDATIQLYRSSLLNSDGYQENEGLDLALLEITSPHEFMCENSFVPTVDVVSKGTIEVSSFQIAMEIDGLVKESISWTGNLSQNEVVKIHFNEVDLSVGSHSIAFELNQVNHRKKDDNPLNDTLNMRFVVLEQQNQSLPFYEGFELIDLSNNNILILNPDNNYTWKRASKGVSIEGEYSYFMDNYNYLSVKTEKDDILLPSFNFTGADQVDLSFYVAAAQFNPFIFEKERDTLQVLVSLDCGQNYDIVYNKGGDELVTEFDAQPDFFEPTKDQWRKEVVDLSNYIDHENVRIIIRNISNYENNIYIDKLKIEGSNATSIQSSRTAVDWKLYPNPTSDYVIIELSDVDVIVQRIDWVNVLGQKVLSKNFKNTYPVDKLSFNLSSWSKGIYIAQIILEDGATLTKKVLLK